MSNRFICTILLAVSTLSVSAIENLRIRAEGTNIVLSWPSTNTATYIVQYRAGMETSTPWTTIANSYAAASDTNWTSFTNVGIIQIHEGCEGGTTLPGPLPPPGGESMMSSTSVQPMSIHDYWMYENREPYAWELERRPPKPNEPISSIYQSSLQNLSLDGSTMNSSSSSMEQCSDRGFFRVVQNGLRIVGITNGANLSGIVTVLVEVGHDSKALESVSLSINQVASEAAATLVPPFPASPSPVLAFELHTGLLTNGTHTLQAIAAFQGGANEDPSQYTVFDSQSITVEVFNEISFPDWMPRFGQEFDALSISATSAHKDVNWSADIYDSQDAYVGSFTGSTTNGLISVAWSLVDGNGIRHNDDFFNIIIETSWTTSGGIQAAGTATAAAPKVVKNKDKWKGPGDWVVVNQQAWEHVTNHELLDEMTDNFVINAEAHGYYVLPSERQESEAYRIRLSDSPTDPTSDICWATFKNALRSVDPQLGHVRNLYYHGHGAPTKLGLSQLATRQLTPPEAAQLLHTAVAGDTNRHGFRFVFLDGCETANGDFPTSFGVKKKENVPITTYANAGERPSAFVGWRKNKVAHVANQIFLDHINYVGWFLFEWYDGTREVRDAFDRAHNYQDASSVNHNELKIYGYSALKYDQFNAPPQ